MPPATKIGKCFCLETDQYESVFCACNRALLAVKMENKQQNGNMLLKYLSKSEIVMARKAYIDDLTQSNR